MQLKRSLFIIILSFLVFVGCDAPIQKEDKVIQKDKTDIYTLKTHNLESISIMATDEKLVFKEFQNKVVLLNFFTTWCPSCKAEIPHLNNLRKKYKDNIKIISVLLDRDKSFEDLSSFIEQNDIKYIVTNSDENFKLAKLLGGVKIVPTMFLYNKKGKLVEKYVGIVPEEMLEMDIKKVIK